MGWKFTSYSRQVESAVQDGVIRALEICGGKAEKYAKKLCPVATGTLRDSITHAAVSENTEAIGTNVSYAPFVEIGTYKMRAQPYLRPAVEGHQTEWEGIIRNELSKV